MAEFMNSEPALFYKAYKAKPADTIDSKVKGGYLPGYHPVDHMYKPSGMDFSNLLPHVEVVQLPPHILGGGTHYVRGVCYTGQRPTYRAEGDPDPYRVDLHENIHYLNSNRREGDVRFSEYLILGRE